MPSTPSYSYGGYAIQSHPHHINIQNDRMSIQNLNTVTYGELNRYPLTRNSIQYNLTNLIIGHEYQVNFKASANDDGLITVGPDGAIFTASNSNQTLSLYIEKNGNINTTYIEALVYDITDNTYMTDSTIMKSEPIVQQECEEVVYPRREIIVISPPTAIYDADKKETNFSIDAYSTPYRDVHPLFVTWGIVPNGKTDAVFLGIGTNIKSTELNYREHNGARVIVILRSAECPDEIYNLTLTIPEPSLLTYEINPGASRAYNTENDILEYSQTLGMSDDGPIRYKIRKFVYERKQPEPTNPSRWLDGVEDILDYRKDQHDYPSYLPILESNLDKSVRGVTSDFKDLGTIKETAFVNGKVDVGFKDSNFKNFFIDHPYGIERRVQTVIDTDGWKNVPISTVIAYVFDVYTEDTDGKEQLLKSFRVYKSVNRVIVTQKALHKETIIGHDVFNSNDSTDNSWLPNTPAIDPFNLSVEANHIMHNEFSRGLIYRQHHSTQDATDQGNYYTTNQLSSSKNPSIKFSLTKKTVNTAGLSQKVFREFLILDSARGSTFPPIVSEPNSIDSNNLGKTYDMTQYLPWNADSEINTIDKLNLSHRNEKKLLPTNIKVKAGDPLNFIQKSVNDNGNLKTIFTRINGRTKAHDGNGILTFSHGDGNSTLPQPGMTLVNRQYPHVFKSMGLIDFTDKLTQLDRMPPPKDTTIQEIWHPRFKGGNGWPKVYNEGILNSNPLPDRPLIIPVPSEHESPLLNPPSLREFDPKWSPWLNVISYGGTSQIKDIFTKTGETHQPWGVFSSFASAFIDYFILPEDNDKYVIANELDSADDYSIRLVGDDNPYEKWFGQKLVLGVKRITSTLTTNHPVRINVPGTFEYLRIPPVPQTSHSSMNSIWNWSSLEIQGTSVISSYWPYTNWPEITQFNSINTNKYYDALKNKLTHANPIHDSQFLLHTHSTPSPEHLNSHPDIPWQQRYVKTSDILAKADGIFGLLIPTPSRTNPYPRGVAFPIGTKASLRNAPFDGDLYLFVPQPEAINPYLIKSLHNGSDCIETKPNTFECTIREGDEYRPDTSINPPETVIPLSVGDFNHVYGTFGMEIEYIDYNVESSFNSTMNTTTTLNTENNTVTTTADSYGITVPRSTDTSALIKFNRATGFEINLKDAIGEDPVQFFNNATYKLDISIPGTDPSEVLYKFSDTFELPYGQEVTVTDKYKKLSELNDIYDIVPSNINFRRYAYFGKLLTTSLQIDGFPQFKIHSITQNATSVTVHANDALTDPGSVLNLGLTQPMLQWFVDGKQYGDAITLPKTAIRENLGITSDLVTGYPNWIFNGVKVHAEIYDKANRSISDTSEVITVSKTSTNTNYLKFLSSPTINGLSVGGTIEILAKDIRSGWPAGKIQANPDAGSVAPIQAQIRLGTTGPIATVGHTGSSSWTLPKTANIIFQNQSVGNISSSFELIDDKFFSTPNARLTTFAGDNGIEMTDINRWRVASINANRQLGVRDRNYSTISAAADVSRYNTLFQEKYPTLNSDNIIESAFNGRIRRLYFARYGRADGPIGYAGNFGDAISSQLYLLSNISDPLSLAYGEPSRDDGYPVDVNPNPEFYASYKTALRGDELYGFGMFSININITEFSGHGTGSANFGTSNKNEVSGSDILWYIPIYISINKAGFYDSATHLIWRQKPDL